MPLVPTRRHFLRTAAAGSLTAVLSERLFAAEPPAESVTVRLDSEIGLVRPEFHGQFAEHLGSCVYGGLWVGKDSKIPNIAGYRRLAVEYLKELGVPVLRWPGGCFADDYHWRDGIGPANKRPRNVNIHWGGYVEDNSFGLHEFIGLCRLIGAEPYLAGNVGSGTPRELRDWIEYCNHPGGSSLSDERSANGSPEPFRVRYWGVGNESWGCGGQMTPEHYADLYRQFSGYARTFGGTKPFLIACGPSGNDMHWSRTFFEHVTGSRHPDGFAMHFYENGDKYPTQFNVDDMNQQFAIFERVQEAIVKQHALLDGFASGKGNRSGLLLDEWGVWDRMNPEEERRNGTLYMQSTMRSAVAAGLGLNLFNRQADKLTMCNIAQVVNVLQSMLLTDGPEGTRCIRTATYHAFSMFKAHRSKISVRVETAASGPLDLSVSASRSGSDLVITFVNPRHDRDLRVDCALAGTAGAALRGAAAQVLHHSDWNAANTFDNPEAISVKSHPVQADGVKLKLDLPGLSVVTATVSLS